MDDKYFEKKAGKIKDMLAENEYLEVPHNIEIVLKEIARDQRHACAEAIVTKVHPEDSDLITRCHQVVMNAYMGDKI